MPFIETTAPETADGAAKELLSGDEAALGYLPNYARMLAQRPEVYKAWKQLNGAIKAQMDPRRYELATIAAAKRLRSTYCMFAHSVVMINALDVDANAMRAIVSDPQTDAVDETERAIMDFAEKVVVDATSVTQADVDRLREFGLTDGDILDVILAATARCFFSKTLDAAGVQADARFATLEPELRDALTVGRPIETAARS
jgi:uncharacterized peroxidase-related enzyme